MLSDREFQFRDPRSVPETRSKLDRAIVDRATIRDLLTISNASNRFVIRPTNKLHKLHLKSLISENHSIAFS